MRYASSRLLRAKLGTSRGAIGGGAGALARCYVLEGVIAERQQSPLPLSTLVINFSGSIALGVLVGMVLAGTTPSGVLVWGGTGFLGGYTTFSTFTYETLRLIEDGGGATPP